jgi:hypothetical protein
MLTKQMRVIAGEDYISSRSVQHQWVGKHIRNDISKCMLVRHYSTFEAMSYIIAMSNLIFAQHMSTSSLQW